MYLWACTISCTATLRQGFASDDGPPHRGQREQSGEDAAQDRQRVAEEDSVSQALSGTDHADAAAAASSSDADVQPGNPPEQAANATDDDVSMVEAELGRLGFEAGDANEELEALAASGLTSLSGTCLLLK